MTTRSIGLQVLILAMTIGCAGAGSVAVRTPSPPLATTSSCYLPGAGPFPDRLPPGMSVEDGLAKGIVGSLDTDDISRVVRTNEGTVKACYERALEGKPTLAGRVTIQFVIAGDGSVEASRLDSSTIGSPSTEACIVETACAWRFPKTQGGGPVTAPIPSPLPRLPIGLER